MDEEDGLEWLTVNNLYSPSLEKPMGNLPMSGNQRQLNHVPPVPGNHLHRLSSVPENYPFQLSRPEINLYNLNPIPDQYRNIITMPNNVNPSFPDTLSDSLLNIDFSRLNLSSPSRYQSSFMAPLMDPSISLPFLSDRQYTNMDLQRLRVESAVRGQMGLCMQLQQDGMHNSSDSNNVASYDFFDDVYPRRTNLGDTVVDRFPTIIRSRANQTGFQSPDFRVECRGRSTINGRESENSSVLRSSLYKSSNFCQSRPRPNFASLEDMRGKMFLVAKDQHGCRFLQKKFEEGNPEEIGFIFSELKDHIRELMVDRFGNYLIQKFFQVCNVEQMTQILLSVASDDRHFMAICFDMHGTRAMQKLLEHLTMAEQRALVVSVLMRITVTLTKSMNGHHVIQHCLKLFPNEDVKHILDVVANNCLEIATDKSGCCVLQQCVAHVHGEAKEHLLAEIIANALVLSENAYGNYVVQYLLGMRIPRVTEDVLAQLVGSYVSLSMNKYGSNVVEKCLKEASEDHSSLIIHEIIHNPNFLMVLQHPYGNYVAQTALGRAKGNLRQALADLILFHQTCLQSHPHGKKVLKVLTKGRKQRM